MSNAGQQQEGQQQQQQNTVGGEQKTVTDYTPFYGALDDTDKTFLAGRKIDVAKVSGKDLITMMRGQDALIGRNNLEQPNLADDKALNDWKGWEALGVPKKAEDYEIKRPEKLPDGMPYDEEGEKVLRNAMVKAKVPAKYAQSIYDKLVNMQITRAGAFAQQQAEAKTAMDTELGKAWGGQKDTNIALAKDAGVEIAKRAGIVDPKTGKPFEPGDISDRLSGVFGDAGAIRILHYIGTALGEDVMKGGGGGAGGIGTPEGAKAELAKLDTDAEFQKALNDRDHPGHASALERRNKLFAIAYPGTTKT